MCVSILHLGTVMTGNIRNQAKIQHSQPDSCSAQVIWMSSQLSTESSAQMCLFKITLCLENLDS